MPLSVCPPNLIGIGLVHRIFNTFCEAPISAIFYRISENSSDSCYPTTFIQRFAMEKAPLWCERLWKKGSLVRSEEHTSELQSRFDLVCRLLLEKKQHE